MNRLCFVLGLLSVVLYCGCVSQSDYDVLVADFCAMNDRVSKMESDLYKVEIKKAPRDTSAKVEEKKFEPNKDVEVAVIDAKTEAFIKEYVGVKFGDDISTIKDDDESNGRNTRNIKLVKPFRYFDKAYLGFTDGKLTSIRIEAWVEKKFSYDSVMKRYEEACDDLALTLGYQQNFSLPVRLRRENKRPTVSISKDYVSSTYGNHYVLKIFFYNQPMVEALRKARNKAGEELPEVK